MREGGREGERERENVCVCACARSYAVLYVSMSIDLGFLVTHSLNITVHLSLSCRKI
jgi:hypothetical protein